MGKIKAWFEERGLTPSDIPLALVAHEVIGLGMAIGFWTSCYAVQPGKTIAKPVASRMAAGRREAVGRAFSVSMATATRQVDKMPWIKKVPGVAGAEKDRLVLSLGESLMLRGAIKPLTFPFKMWASYQVVMLTKRGRAPHAAKRT